MNQPGHEQGMARVLNALLCALMTATLFGCGASEQPDEAQVADIGADPDPVFAEAAIQPVGASGVTGLVRFDQRGDVLQVSGEIEGLSPGDHGLHIHAGRDCSPDGTDSGHFSPENHPHGSPDLADAEHHAGDLGNITADGMGTADFELSDTELQLGTGANDVIGLAIVVHAQADDLATQPDGNAGAAVGCGLVDVVPQPDYVPQ